MTLPSSSLISPGVLMGLVVKLQLLRTIIVSYLCENSASEWLDLLIPYNKNPKKCLIWLNKKSTDVWGWGFEALPKCQRAV